MPNSYCLKNLKLKLLNTINGGMPPEQDKKKEERVKAKS